MEPEFIGVIGGNGGMGTLMVRIFEQAGYGVKVFDPRQGPFSWKEAAQCPVLLLATPITAMNDVLENIGPHTRKDGAVIDICSIKKAPVEAMLEHCRGEVIGSHPLFGPSTESLKDQVVFLSPARTGNWLDWFKAFLESQGSRIVEIDPVAHDELMSRIQVLRHLLLISFGLSLSRLDFNIKENLPLSGQWFSQLVGMLDAQLDQGPGLYADMALNNPATEQVMGEFIKAAGEVSDTVASGDRGAVINLINEVSSFLKNGNGNSSAQI